MQPHVLEAAFFEPSNPKDCPFRSSSNCLALCAILLTIYSVPKKKHHCGVCFRMERGAKCGALHPSILHTRDRIFSKFMRHKLGASFVRYVRAIKNRSPPFPGQRAHGIPQDAFCIRKIEHPLVVGHMRSLDSFSNSRINQSE